jgi:hypothetical protein
VKSIVAGGRAARFKVAIPGQCEARPRSLSMYMIDMTVAIPNWPMSANKHEENVLGDAHLVSHQTANVLPKINGDVTYKSSKV